MCKKQEETWEKQEMENRGDGQIVTWKNRGNRRKCKREVMQKRPKGLRGELEEICSMSKEGA